MMGSNDPTSRVCSWQNKGPRHSGLCREPATNQRKRHSHVNIGTDNFFFVDCYYCDEHAKEFDDNPPPGEKAWREWKARADQGGGTPRDPYLGTKKAKPQGRKKDDPCTVFGEPKQQPRRSSSRGTGPKTPDHPTCTNITMTGDVCRKPIAQKFIGRKNPMFHLCPQCAKDLAIE